MSEVKTPFDLLVDQIRAVVREEIAAALATNKPKPKLLFTTEEAAELVAVPVTWLAEAARQNKVPSVRVGHYVRFKIDDLRNFIEQSAGNGKGHT